MFDDLFGGMFDFNDDGTTDFLEAATGFAILDELSEDNTDDLDDGFDNNFDDEFDDDTDDFDLDSDDDWDF